MITAVRRRRRIGVAVTFALFVLLGLPEGILGTAWPTMRASFGEPVSSLAWLVALYTVGYLLSTVLSGHVTERIGVALTLRIGVFLTAGGLLLYAVTPTWWVAVAAAAVTGLGGGTVDAAANSYVAVVGGARAMNLLHAMFGIGATAGPLLVTASLGLDAGWRPVYVLVLGAELVMLVAIVRFRDQFRVAVEATDGPPPRAPMPRGLLAAMLALFFFYVGSEAAYGHWTFSLLTDERGVGSTTAGWAVAGYWGGLTLGRLVLAYAAARFESLRVLSVSVVAIVLGAVVFWLDPAPGLDIVALPWLGLAMAGVFPALVLVTPGWLGAANTARAVGYQLAASSVGAIVVSAVIGLVVRSSGIDAMPVVLFVVTVGSLVSFQVARMLAPTR